MCWNGHSEQKKVAEKDIEVYKIGRVQDESGALYFKEGLGIDIVASYVRNCYDICISGNKMLKDIKYLHQLQHFLFGLGLNPEMEVWK